MIYCQYGQYIIDSLQSFESLTALAKELKISRQTLYKRLNKNNLKGRLSFTKEELSLLKKRQVKSVNADNQTNGSSYHKTLIFHPKLLFTHFSIVDDTRSRQKCHRLFAHLTKKSCRNFPAGFLLIFQWIERVASKTYPSSWQRAQ
ncbi:helix-turn-helix domain-containing protein [Fructobacillus papyriferae]